MTVEAGHFAPPRQPVPLVVVNFGHLPSEWPHPAFVCDGRLRLDRLSWSAHIDFPEPTSGSALTLYQCLRGTCQNVFARHPGSALGDVGGWETVHADRAS